MHTANLRSVAYLTVSGSEPVEQIEAAGAAGFDAVGLRVVAPLGLQLAHPIVGHKPLIREIKRASKRTGVRVFDSEVLTLTSQTNVSDFLPALEAAAEIGATYMQITSEDPDWGRGAANFAMVCDAAAGLGLRIALEFMRWRSVHTIEEAAKFVRDAGRENGGIVLDTLHLSRSNGSPAAVAAVPPEQLMYVQLCDAGPKIPATNDELLAEARGGRLYPGDGDLWLDELFDVLPDNIAISIEVPGAAPADASVRERTKRAGKALEGWLKRYRTRR